MKGIIFQEAKASYIHSLPVGALVQTRRVCPIQVGSDQSYCARCRIAIEHCQCVFGGTPSDQIQSINLNTRRYTVSDARYKLGETLYVKEPWRTLDGSYIGTNDALARIGFADGLCRDVYAVGELRETLKTLTFHGKPRNPLFMPEQFSRTTIRINSIKCERARDISAADAKLEGFRTQVMFCCPECRGEGEYARPADDMDRIEGLSCGGFVHGRCSNCGGFGTVEGSYADMEDWGAPVSETPARDLFIRHFETLNGPGSADSWCWVYGCEVVGVR